MSKNVELKPVKTVEEMLAEQMKKLEKLNNLSKDRTVLKTSLMALDTAIGDINDMMSEPNTRYRFQLQFSKIHDMRETLKIAQIGDLSTILEFAVFLNEKIKVRLNEVETQLLG